MSAGNTSRTLLVGVYLFALVTGGVVVHVAGVPPSEVGSAPEEGPATATALYSAEDVAVAPNGDIYIADANSQRLLRIRGGFLTVVYRGDFSAGENEFTAVAVAPDGTVYFTTGLAVLSLVPDGTLTEVSDTDPGFAALSPKLAVGPDGVPYLAGGSRPRLDRIESDGSTTLVAGSDVVTSEPGVGDGGPAVDAVFGRISDVAIDSQGFIYLADEFSGDVRRVGLDGIVTTVFGAGSIAIAEAIDGTAAVDVDYESAEIGIAIDSLDRLYVIPRLAGKVWMVENGAITTVVGGGTNPGTGFPPLETQLQGAFRVALTPDDDLLILVEDGRFLYQVGGVARGSLIDSVPSPTNINLDPLVIAASIGLAAGMLFLIPFPAEIFNNTLAEHHDQIRAWFRRRKDQTARGFWDTSWGLAVGLLLMTLLLGFLDPGFGINPASLPTLAGLLIGVLITTMGFALPTLLMRRKRTGEWGRLRALPVALIVGVACVVLSRLIGFQPGYLYGIVLGLVFAKSVGGDAEAAEVTVTAIILAAIALGAWFGLGAVRSSDGGTFSELVEGALAMTTVSAFEGLVFGLLPIHGMPGRVLFKHRRWLWAGMWGFSVLAFFHVLVNPRSGYLVDTAVVPVATTYGLLALFSLVSFALWSWSRRKSQASSRLKP